MNRATLTPIYPSPMRLLRAWLFRERSVRGPGAIELDVVERQVDRETAAITAECTASANIERRLQHAREKLSAAMTDGVIDATESASLARCLIGTSVAAHHHTEKLEALR